MQHSSVFSPVVNGIMKQSLIKVSRVPWEPNIQLTLLAILQTVIPLELWLNIKAVKLFLFICAHQQKICFQDDLQICPNPKVV